MQHRSRVDVPDPLLPVDQKDPKQMGVGSGPSADGIDFLFDRLLVSLQDRFQLVFGTRRQKPPVEPRLPEPFRVAGQDLRRIVLG
ncbi:MAG: hypothetical protein MUF20_10740, partial [Methylotetracoccus sp.]|nr:hypothetical protein [Methylotetracoccus sp.]